MKQILYKYRFLFWGFLTVYALSMTFFLYEVDYTLTSPAYNDNIGDTIVIPSDYEIEGSFHTTSVFSLENISLYQYYVGQALKTVDVEEMGEFYTYVDTSDLVVMNRLFKDDSIETSLVVGIREANKDIDYSSLPTVFLTYTHLSPDTIEIGDAIVSVNGRSDIYEAFGEVACHDSAHVIVLRDDQELEFDITKNDIQEGCSFGLYIGPLTILEDTEVDYVINKSLNGGPSGGLLQSLYVYNQLTEFDYTYGLKIGGTGTIDVDGNVGYIGGVRQKVITSITNGIDIFFVPHLNDEESDNYIEAMATLEEFDTDMIVVGVASFDEALEFLMEWEESHE
jgi:PDZ domain-containing protein